MLLAVAVVGGLAHWDGERESLAALDDFADAQANVAQAAGAELATRLRDVRHDALLLADGTVGRMAPPPLANSYLATRVTEPNAAPSVPSTGSTVTLRVPIRDRAVDLDLPPASLLEGVRGGDVPGKRITLLLSPADGEMVTAMDGRRVSAPWLHAAFRDGRATLRLSREEARMVGLTPRTAMAGLAGVDGGPLGRWGVVVVSTAATERDRETRGRIRLLASLTLAGGLVAGFGSLALQRQRKEMALEGELALADAVRRRDERLVRANRAATMGTLAMGVAHEIGTPLGVIAGRAEQLLAGGPDGRTERSARAILDQSTRIGEIVRGFLALARGEKPTIATVAPGDIVRGALRLVEHRFAQGEVALSVDLPSDLPYIHCDGRLLEHALVNLLLNARDACAGKGRVEIVVRTLGDAIAFVVSDDGVGITPDDALRATEPFFTTKAAEDGAGLGLAIAQEIAKSHLGSLTIGPQSPSGTRAKIEIPIRQDGEHA